MARRAAKIKEQRLSDERLLLLSAGDWSAAPGIVGMYRSRFLAETMIELRYDAVAVGERDLAFGMRTLKQDAERGLPLISANLYEGGERVFPPYLVKTIRGIRVGVVALLGTAPRGSGGVEIRDPASEGRAAIERLRDRADYIICLAHMTRDRLDEVLPSLSGADLVIRAHTADFEDAGDGCADSMGGRLEDAERPILFAGDRGRAIGRVVVAPAGGGPCALIERQLIELDGAVPDDPETAERLGAFLAEERGRQRELSTSGFLARDGGAGRIVERYVGVDVCARCHGAMMPRFVGSRHFRAMETLRSRGRDGDPSCLPCHTTGYGNPTGYSLESEAKGAPYLQGVQCEACHGPGTRHERTGSYAEAGRRSCGACHTSTWSPDFSYDLYWPRAAHCGSAAARPSAAGAP